MTATFNLTRFDRVADIARLEKADVIAYDVETTGLCAVRDKLRLLQLGAHGCGDPLVIDLWETSAEERQQLREFFSQSKIWVAHNAIFDTSFLQEAGFPLPQTVRCTLLASILIWNGKRPTVKHGLADVVDRFLGRRLLKTEQASDWGNPVLRPEQIAYARRDVQALLDLWEPLNQALIESGQYQAWIHECDVIPALAQMQRFGLRWNRAQIMEVRSVLAGESAELEAAFRAAVKEKVKYEEDPLAPKTLQGKELNLNSPKQMQYIFTTLMGEPPLDAKGKVSAASTTLKEYVAKSEEIEVYLKFKKAIKLVQMIDSISKDMDPAGVVRPSYRQLGAETGRMSASKPNVQQIPRRSDFRACVHAKPGYKLIAADYSQMELRLAAVESDDEAMCLAFMNDQDLHTVTAKAIYNTDQPTKEQRQVAKSANFGLLYGAGAEGLRRYAVGMGVRLEEEEAKRIRDKFLETYEGIHTWQRYAAFRASRQSEHLGDWPWVRIRRTNMRRYLKGDMNRLTTRCNTVIQGAGAAVLKKSLATLWPFIEQAGEDQVRLLTCVHDEIVLEVREDFAEDWAVRLKRLMEEVESLWLLNNCGEQVPPKVDVNIGDNWADCK